MHALSKRALRETGAASKSSTSRETVGGTRSRLTVPLALPAGHCGQYIDSLPSWRNELQGTAIDFSNPSDRRRDAVRSEHGETRPDAIEELGGNPFVCVRIIATSRLR